MEWTKISTTLITKRFSDYEIASIVKFQLVWALNEEQPDRATALRYMTAKQYETAMTYIDSLSARVSDDVSSVIKKRSAEKIRYNKNKDLLKNLQADCKHTGIQTAVADKIRLDKIRLDKEYIEKFDEFWNCYTPIKSNDGRFVAKGNKKACQEKYIKLIKQGEKHETIIRGLEQYLKYCQQNGMCSCGAEVFINQRRWENDYSDSRTIQSSNSNGVHSKHFDIMETARQFAEVA